MRVWASRNTTKIAEMAQEFKLRRDNINTRAPKKPLMNEAWELAILAPRKNKVTKLARDAFKERTLCVYSFTDGVGTL